MRKTFLYRARINRQTEANCEQWFELCRTLYNLALEQRIYAYRQQRKSISVYEQMRQLVELKKEYLEFKTVGSQVLQDVLERLDKAYKSFFRRIKENNGKAGFPRFRGRDSYNSFTLKQCGWQLEGRYLHIKGIGRFKLFLSRPIEGDIKTVTVSRAKSGKFFVAFSCDNVPAKPLPKTGRRISIDVGCEWFLTDTKGDSIANPRLLNKSEDLIEKRQQRVSHRIKGSNRRQKARVLLAKAHEKVANQRRDFHFKVAWNLVKKNDVIYIENMRAWTTEYRRLNRSMRDVAWFQFFGILKAKATEAAREVIPVPAKNTTQKCFNCGRIVRKGLSDRVHFCPDCFVFLHRDHNSALNIFRDGQSLQSSKTLRISRL